MKKMKKILAMFLAFAMVLGMTIGASAETTTNLPKATDKATATVQNVEIGDDVEVTAYQIVKGKYDATYGFLGYELADESIVIASKQFLPTAEEVTTIAAAINAGTLDLGDGVKLTPAEAEEGAEVTSYSAQLTAGYWVVLVRKTVDVYNPMLVGIYYKVEDASGDNGVLEGGSVDADSSWTLEGTDAYAKKSEIDITKVITSTDKKADGIVGDVAYGDTVSFEINTTVPDYSEEYTTAVFTITDTMDKGLTLDAGSIVLSFTGAAEAPVKDTDYTVTLTEEGEGEAKSVVGFVIDFSDEWLLANGATAVKVTYSAEVNENATTNFVPNTNKVKLTYTNNPDTTKDTEEKITRHYTFEIDGFVNGTGSEVTEEIVKQGTKIVNGQEVTTALDGATFAIRKKGTTDVIATTVSKDGGLLNFKGLDADVEYEIYETKAPLGWTINNTIYTAKITAEYDDEGILESYTVTITNDKDSTVGTSVHSTTDKGQNVTVQNGTTFVPNTQLINLPSTGGIGTTIFTVAGCVIMIAAAFLFFASRRKEEE